MSKFSRSTMVFRHKIKEFYYGVRYLSFCRKNNIQDENLRNALITFVDGRMYHGGLTDRFKGIIDGYLSALYLNRPFKIKYNFPFDLTDYLLPNKYDWTIDDNNISNSFFHTKVLCTSHENGKRTFKIKSDKQIRLYTNWDYFRQFDFPPFDKEWGDVFNYLFKPSPLLQKHIDQTMCQLGCDYIAVVFRFQNLLNDFKEYKFQPIKDNEYKEKLIQANLDELKKLAETNKVDGKMLKILVTSDSSTFLDRAVEIPNVYAIKGKTAHMDTKNNGNTNNLKAFLDFFMVSKAKAVYAIVIDDMYCSEFPIYAAKVGNIPFTRVKRHL